jgi:ribosomal protein L32
MARKKRRKPGLQRCANCGEFQLPQELEHRICMVCLGLIAVKPKRRPPAAAPKRPDEANAVQGKALEAASA